MARVAALLLFAALNISAADWTVYLRRSGPVRVGMKSSNVRRIIGDPKAYLENGTDVPLNQCAYLESAKLPMGLGFMFAQWRVVRIDVFEPGIATASGIQVGDSEEKVLQTYPGQIRVDPHPYLDDLGHYLVFTPKDPSDSNYGMIFETGEGKVTSYRVGTKRAIALIEGCA